MCTVFSSNNYFCYAFYGLFFNVLPAQRLFICVLHVLVDQNLQSQQRSFTVGAGCRAFLDAIDPEVDSLMLAVRLLLLREPVALVMG